MHNLSCENEFYLYENEKWFSHQRLSTYSRFETEAPGNSEMASYGHKIPKRFTQADKSNNKAHTVMIKLVMYRNICLAFNLIPVFVFSDDFGVPCKFAQATRTGRGGGGPQGKLWYSPLASMTSRLSSVTFKMVSKVFIEETDKSHGNTVPIS